MSDRARPACRPRIPPAAFLSLLALVAAAAPARAADFAVGVAAGLSQGRVDCVDAYPCDRRDTQLQAHLAWRVTPTWDLRLTVFDAGSFDGGGTTPAGLPFGGTFEPSGVALGAVYRWALSPAWSLQGQLGVANVRTRFGYASPHAGSVSRSTTQPLVGLAVAWQASPRWQWTAGIDATRFEAHTRRGALRLVGVGLQASF